jgi:Tfp pilus assembly PilM family ATPase
MRLPFKTDRGPIGIDIGTTSIKAVQISRPGGNGLRIESAAILPLDAAHNTLDTATISRLRDVMARQGFRGSRCVLAVLASKLQVELLELPPRSSGAPVDQIARTEMIRLGKLESEPFEMASWDLPASSRGNAGTTVMAVAARFSDTEPLYQLFESSGFAVESIDVQATAIARACAGRIDHSQMTAALDLGYSRATLFLLHGGLVVFQRVLSHARLESIYNELMQRLDVDLEVAQHLLVRPDESSAESEQARQITTIVEHYCDSILSDLDASFAYSRHRYPELAMGSMFVLGGGSSIHGLPEALGERLNRQVQMISPVVIAPCASAAIPRCSDGLLTMALGLALYEGE